MISKQDLERLLTRGGGEHPIASLFLDLSVNADNKRTVSVFLNKQRSYFDELDSDRANHHRAAIGEFFAQVDQWLDEEYREENRGAAIYAELGGEWFEAMQFPVLVPNRLVIGEHPVISPLAQVMREHPHHGVVVVDRERLRILSVYLDTLLDEVDVHTEPLDEPAHVQAGGYSQSGYQRRKLEERRHFFREFAKEVEEFDRRYRPDDLVLLGTEENLAAFREHLSQPLLQKVIYSGGVRVDESFSEIMERVEPFLAAERVRGAETLVQQLKERVGQDYLAASGIPRTLSALQEGKIDTLVVARDLERPGTRCTQCGFIFSHDQVSCPFDGGSTAEVRNVVEEMVRIAEGQGAVIEFVDPGAVEEVRGVGALLRY